MNLQLSHPKPERRMNSDRREAIAAGGTESYALDFRSTASIGYHVNQPHCPGAAAARVAHGARAIDRSVRFLARTETLALYSRQSSVAHRGLRMARCAARTSFHLLR